MIKMIQKNMNKKGFTLVELIIVIAVMAIIAAVVVPRMSGITQTFRENADQRQCENYAREIELLVQIGETVADNGTVVSVIAEATETPASEDGTAFRYVFEENATGERTGNIVVYVDDAAQDYDDAVALTDEEPDFVNAIRDNAVVINQ